MIKVSFTEEEALQIVGCLKICSKLDGGIAELDKIADRITKAHIDKLKKEFKNEILPTLKGRVS